MDVDANCYRSYHLHIRNGNKNLTAFSTLVYQIPNNYASRAPQNKINLWGAVNISFISPPQVYFKFFFFFFQIPDFIYFTCSLRQTIFASPTVNTLGFYFKYTFLGGAGEVGVAFPFCLFSGIKSIDLQNTYCNARAYVCVCPNEKELYERGIQRSRGTYF